MRQHPLILGLVTVGVFGCALNTDTSHTRSHTEDLGVVGLAIALAPGLDISTLSYSVQVPGLDPIQGTLPIAADGTFRGQIDDVPAAEGVRVLLSASGASGATCSGEGTITVRAGEIASLMIGLQCRVPVSTPPPPTTGSISIQGNVDVCPRLIAASATAGTAANTSAITATAEDADGDSLRFAWSANAGSFADAAAASTSFTCAAAGDAMLTVTVDDGRGCTDSKALIVKCELPTEPPPPPPPAADAIPCDVQQILQAKCQSCHGDPPTSGPMPLVSLAQLHADSPGVHAGTPVYVRVKERIHHATNPMPPSWGSTGPLSAEQLARLDEWLLAGAPGATCPAPQ